MGKGLKELRLIRHLLEDLSAGYQPPKILVIRLRDCPGQSPLPAGQGRRRFSRNPCHRHNESLRHRPLQVVLNKAASPGWAYASTSESTCFVLQQRSKKPHSKLVSSQTRSGASTFQRRFRLCGGWVWLDADILAYATARYKSSTVQTSGMIPAATAGAGRFGPRLFARISPQKLK